MNTILPFIIALLFYIFQYLILFYFLAIALIYAVTTYFGIRSIVRYHSRLTQQSLDAIVVRDTYVPISILVPAYNEEASIVGSVRSFLTLHYPEFEVIVMSDGSTDNTMPLMIEAFELYEVDYPFEINVYSEEILKTYRSVRYPNLIVGEKINGGGKADATNAALNVAKYPLVCAVDADSLLNVDALLRASRIFLNDETVIGVGATIRPLNGAVISDGKIRELKLPSNIIAQMQILEYSRAFFGGRAGWAHFDALLIISGAFGLFRRDMMLELDGWATDTMTEDLELMVKIHKHYRDHEIPYRIAFIPEPLCWTEVPTDIRSLRQQRNRWHRGLIEVLWKYREMTLNPRYGVIGMVAIPYFWVVEAFSPLIEFGGYLFVIIAIIFGWLSVEFAVGLLILAFLYGVLLSQITMGIEALLVYRYSSIWDRITLMMTSMIEMLGYRQILLYERFVAIFQVQSKRGEWGKINRTGF